jgi:hypothetical protein
MAIHYMESAARRTDLDRGQKLVLMCYANSANDENRVGFPGFEALTTWSGLGRSQLYNVISQLSAKGLLVKVRDGGRGRRAEYAVYPRGGCCPMHGPLPGYSELVDEIDAPDPVELPEVGSDPSDPGPDLHVQEAGSDPSDPEPALQGPTMGPTMGPTAIGPLTGSPAPTTHLEEVTHVSSGDDLEAPSPELPDGIQRTCREHRLRPALGACPPCGDWRRAADSAGVQRALDAASRAEDARQAARDASELARRELRSCPLCDVEGRLPSGLICLHDPAKNPRVDGGGYAAFQQLRAAGVKRPEDGRDPESGRRKARAARTSEG